MYSVHTVENILLEGGHGAGQALVRDWRLLKEPLWVPCLRHQSGIWLGDQCAGWMRWQNDEKTY